MADFVALNEFTEALRSAVDGGRSGAFFLTSPDQHSAMITLSNGRITGVKYRSMRGYEAAEVIAGFGQVRFQTSPDLTELPGQPSIDTGSILAMLSSNQTQSADTESGPGTPAPQSISSEQFNALRNRYIQAIGPIGGAIFDEEAATLDDQTPSGQELSRFIDRLAEQIDDEKERESFRRDATSGHGAA